MTPAGIGNGELNDRISRMERRLGGVEMKVVAIEASLRPLDALAEEIKQLTKTVLTFITDHKAREEAEKEHEDDKHKSNTEKIEKSASRVGWLTLVVLALTLVVTAISVFIGYMAYKNHGMIVIPNMSSGVNETEMAGKNKTPPNMMTGDGSINW